MITYIQSPAEDPHGSGVRTFLAGGAKDPWRRRFAQLMAARDGDFVLYDPINFEWHEHALPRRIEWEIRHFERAEVVVAWLPGAPADDLSAQSPTTCFELGQLVTIKTALHVGIAPHHPARDVLLERLRTLSVVDSLEELAARVPTQAPTSRPHPPRRDDERHFHFGREVRFEDLFDLGVAVRTLRPRVTIDDDCPVARELRAQLALLL
jgi:hypothetical protein